jgi:drug/metabolite transporter (DMT)-like permease
MPSVGSLTLLALAVPPLLWAGNFIVGRAVREDISPLTLVFLRHLLAFLCLLPFCWRHLRRDAAQYWHARWFLVRTAVSGMLLFNVLIYFGLHSTTATNALLLNSAIPVLIAVFSLLLFRQRTSLPVLVGLAVSLTGVLSIVSRGRWDTLLQLQVSHGDALALAGVASFALYSIWLRQMPAGLHRLSVVCAQFLVATVLLLPAYLWDVASGASMAWTWSNAAAIAYVAIGSAVVATVFYAAAVRRLGAAHASLCIHLTPVFGAFMGAWWLSESIQPYHWLGMLLILSGLGLATLRWASVARQAATPPSAGATAVRPLANGLRRP